MGLRAKRRRQVMRVSSDLMAKHLDLPLATFRAMEYRLPIKRHDIEEKWEKALQVPHGWLRQANDMTDYPVATHDLSMVALMPHPTPTGEQTVASEIVAIGSWLASRNHADATLPPRVTRHARQKAKVFAEYYGVLGDKAENRLPASSPEAAATISRLMNKKTLANLDLERDAPSLHKLLQDTLATLPCKAEALDETFQEKLGARLTVRDALRFARDAFGVRSIDMPPDSCYLFAAAAGRGDDLRGEVHANLVRRIAAEARAQIYYCGAACCEKIADRVTVNGRPITEPIVRDIVTQTSGFEWLDRHGNWFCSTESDANPVLMIAAKVLTVSRRTLTHQELVAAFERLGGKGLGCGASKLPEKIFAALLRRQGWMRRSGKFSASELLVGDALTPAELRLYHLLSRHPDGAPRREILSELQGDPLAPHAASILLRRSAFVVYRPRKGYSLIGHGRKQKAA